MQAEVIKVIGYFVSFVGFFIVQRLCKGKGAIRFVDEQGITNNPRGVMFLHIAGILFFGLLPVFYTPEKLIYSRQMALDSWKAGVVGMLLLIAISTSIHIAGIKFKAAQNGPLNNNTSNAHLILYLIIRVVFICVYESWFRGYFLFDAIAWFGPPLAVETNVLLYALLHIVNGRDEVRACVPFGLLLCGLCMWLGAAWPAMLLHSGLTLSFEIRFIQRLKMSKQMHHAYYDNRRSRIPG